MLTPDRMADLAAATAQPASLNKDFSPILYYYHLRRWMSQFNVGFGPVQAGLLVLLGLYLLRLRGCAPVLFASGFAASALEIVLLLAFQVVCGSVYHQVGVVVTVFMAGLALGAWIVNRISGRGARPPRAQWLAPSPATLGGGQDNAPFSDSGTASATRRGRRVAAPEAGALPRSNCMIPAKSALLPFGLRTSDFGLPILSLAIAAYAALLPLFLPLLTNLGGTAASLLLVKAIVVLLTLILAVLVGMQFPLANRLEFDGTAAAASRLYTADFIGACLGALLACTLLIPLIGVGGVCWLTAALNVLGCGLMKLRKAVT
jgi:hypothetical protein